MEGFVSRPCGSRFVLAATTCRVAVRYGCLTCVVVVLRSLLCVAAVPAQSSCGCWLPGALEHDNSDVDVADDTRLVFLARAQVFVFRKSNTSDVD